MAGAKVNTILSKRIKDLRREYRLTKSQLAEALQISPAYITVLESGNRCLSTEKLIALSSFFGVTVDYLIKEDYESEQETGILPNEESTHKHKKKYMELKAIEVCRLDDTDFEYLINLINSFLSYSKNKDLPIE